MVTLSVLSAKERKQRDERYRQEQIREAQEKAKRFSLEDRAKREAFERQRAEKQRALGSSQSKVRKQTPKVQVGKATTQDPFLLFQTIQRARDNELQKFKQDIRTGKTIDQLQVQYQVLHRNENAMRDILNKNYFNAKDKGNPPYTLFKEFLKPSDLVRHTSGRARLTIQEYVKFQSNTNVPRAFNVKMYETDVQPLSSMVLRSRYEDDKAKGKTTAKTFDEYRNSFQTLDDLRKSYDRSNKAVPFSEYVNQQGGYRDTATTPAPAPAPAPTQTPVKPTTGPNLPKQQVEVTPSGEQKSPYTDEERRRTLKLYLGYPDPLTPEEIQRIDNLTREQLDAEITAKEREIGAPISAERTELTESDKRAREGQKAIDALDQSNEAITQRQDDIERLRAQERQTKDGLTEEEKDEISKMTPSELREAINKLSEELSKEKTTDPSTDPAPAPSPSPAPATNPNLKPGSQSASTSQEDPSLGKASETHLGEHTTVPHITKDVSGSLSGMAVIKQPTGLDDDPRVLGTRDQPIDDITQKIGTRKAEEDKQRQRKTIDRLKDEIKALHLLYDDNIPEFKSKAHIGQKNDALKSRDLSVVRKHHADMEFIVARYYKREPQMRLGVILDAEDYLSMYSIGEMTIPQGGAMMGQAVADAPLGGIHSTYVSGGLAVARREPVANRLVKSLNAPHRPSKITNPLSIPVVDTYRAFTVKRPIRPSMPDITFKTLNKKI